jgi:hypothetical protein
MRNGAPFKDWDLPPALTQVRAKLKQHAKEDRLMERHEILEAMSKALRHARQL